jgi:hypothetical protein
VHSGNAPGGEKHPLPGGRRLVLFLALFFGAGYSLGFFTGLGYSKFYAAGEFAETPDVPSDETSPAPMPESPDDSAGMPETSEPADDPPDADPDMQGIDLVLGNHSLDEDENGLFISGTVINRSDHAFDAVRIAFDLCDSNDRPYSYVTDTAAGRMEPGDSWGFTIYIPYTEMSLFQSYRLQSIMGVTN